MDIEKALIDVRRSYRLIYEYQRTLLETLSYIENKLNITYSGGYPRWYNNPPNRGAGKLSNSSWDWLSMYSYEFKFRLKAENYYFSVLHIADSGCWYPDYDSIDTDETSSFESSEKARTYLFFFYGKEKNRDNDIEYVTEEGNIFNEDESFFYSKSPERFIKRYSLSAFKTIEKIDDTLNDLKCCLVKCNIEL